MKNINEMTFDLDRIEVPVKIGDKPYVLKDATGAAAAAYRNAVMGGMVLGPEGKPSRVTDMGRLPQVLLSGCLFERTSDGDIPIAENVIAAWPERVVQPLFARAKQISELDEQDTNQQLLESLLSRSDSPIPFATLAKYIENLAEEGNKDAEELAAWLIVDKDSAGNVL